MTTIFAKYHYQYGGLVVFSLIFVLLHPFLGFCMALITLFSRGDKLSNKSKNLLFAVLAFFLALVAFTQVSPEGDITRTYGGIMFRADSDWREFLKLSIAEDKYILFSVLNNIIYTLTGRVEFVSLVWIFVLYYFSCKAIENIISYYKLGACKRTLFVAVFAFIFCFVIFTQVTEIMKQAVAAALFLYANSLWLIGKKKKTYIIAGLSLMIHATAWFYIPLFFVNKLKMKFLVILAIASFAFRQFNLMDFIANFLGRLNSLSTLRDIAEGYSSFDKEFFSSSATYFLVTFAVFFIFVLLAYWFNSDKNSPLMKILLAYIVILNFNYSSDHNFTRMLTMLFPFYTFILMVVKSSHKYYSYKSVFYFLFLACTAFINYYLVIGRLWGTGYTTSYMNGSLTNLLTYTLFDYFSMTIY